MMLDLVFCRMILCLIGEPDSIPKLSKTFHSNTKWLGRREHQDLCCTEVMVEEKGAFKSLGLHKVVARFEVFHCTEVI